MAKAEEDAVAAARAGDAPADPKLAALYSFARSMVARRGHVRDDDVQAVLDAGYSHAAVLDVVAQIGHTTIANLAHNAGDAPLDEAFAPQAWAKAAA